MLAGPALITITSLANMETYTGLNWFSSCEQRDPHTADRQALQKPPTCSKESSSSRTVSLIHRNEQLLSFEASVAQ